MSVPVTDQMARDNATKALTAIATHELVCAERQGHIIERLKKLDTSVQGINSRLWAMALSCIGGCIIAVATLLFFVITHKN